MKIAWRELLPLPILALCGALLLTGIYLGVNARIAANRQRAADTILLDALTLPADAVLRVNGTTDDQALLTLRTPRKIYLAQQHGQIVALILPLTARDGYNGDIDLVVAIDSNGAIVNVHAIAHRETTGLGDRIDSDKSAWIKQFAGKSLHAAQPEQWSLKNSGGDFDQITGATVTSRAVIDAVYRALQYFDLHREQLLQSTAIEEDGHAGA